MKKNIILLLSMLFSNLIYSQNLKWMSMEEAVAAQKINPKKMIIDFYTNWCGPCKMMDKNTYSHPVIASYINENFYAVKVNAEGNEKINFQGRTFINPNYKASQANSRNSQHEFAAFFNIYAYPSLMLMDEKFQPITNIKGYVAPKEIEPYLQMIAKDEYLKIKTREEWESYQKKFKSKL